MKNFNLLQIIPSLDSGGVEQGTVDVANFIGEKDQGSFVVSNGGKMLALLNRKKTGHFKLPIHSKNIFSLPFVAKKLNKIIVIVNFCIKKFCIYPSIYNSYFVFVDFISINYC